MENCCYVQEFQRKDGLPKDLEYAQQVIAQRDEIIEEGHQNAESLITNAREEVARMIEQTAIVKAAREESKRILAEGREIADEERAEVEQYIDSRLATLEVILTKTMDAVARGREKLAGADERDVLAQLADDN